MKNNFLLFIFLLKFSCTFCQKSPDEKPILRCLIFQMTGKTRNIHFHEGGYITLKSFANKHKQQLKIVQLTDSSFLYFPYEDQHSVFDLQEVKFRDIKKIYSGGKNNILGMKGVGALGGAGVFLFSFDMLNQIGKPNIKVNPTIVVISASLIGVSVIINKFINPVYRVNKKHYLKLYHIENPKLHY